MANLNEKEIKNLIDEKSAYLRENEYSMSPLAVQNILDEITELRASLKKIDESKLAVTPVLNAPLKKDHPKNIRTNFTDSSFRL